MSAPSFYKIDCEREVVMQGKSSLYITVSRNDDPTTGMLVTDDLYVCVYLQPYTFETHYQELTITANGTATVIANTTSATGVGFNQLTEGSEIKDYTAINPAYTTAPQVVSFVETSATSSTITFDQLITAGTYTIELGKYALTGNNWEINAEDTNALSTLIENTLSTSAFATSIPNPFDGTLAPAGTGYLSRNNVTRWVRVEFDANNTNTKGATFKIDYDGMANSHLKLNLLCVQGNALSAGGIASILSIDSATPSGLKTGVLGSHNSNADYQEIHLFGYPESYLKTSRDTTANQFSIFNPLYEDRVSYGLLKTNPKLSGNVKLTTDSQGSLWLNSFSANDELSDSRFKRFPISNNSTYQKDLWNFFRKGVTPPNVVFDLYQEDNQYLNNKESYAKQYDNFYNYGVEQLRSKFYDEDFTFLAPIWLKSVLPDFFVILRVNHPIDENSYNGNPLSDSFADYFQEAQIVKTFDMRSSSKLGTYIRKIVNDPRFKEKPLDISWENDVATYWNGFSYQSGTMASKAEFLYQYYRQDRPIKEFEDYITGGFERNGVMCSNLLNLEFLFNDDEAPLYGINRYCGFYVTENQLAEFEIEPLALSKINLQSPPPKKGVDGEPYSTRSFIQTNPNGIEIPINYYHTPPFANNTSVVPAYQGSVVGKLPLPVMVDDPLRFFYVKDRDDVFKRIIGLTEKDYGFPGTKDYLRVSQLQLFDQREDISKYGGVNQIVSQFGAQPLSESNTQLVVELDDLRATGVFADDEEIYLKVEKYNDFGKDNDYVVQLQETDNATFATLLFFMNKFVARLTSTFVQPAVGGTVTATVDDTSGFVEGQTLYMSFDPTIVPPADHGSYLITSIVSATTMVIQNIGGTSVVPATTVVPIECLFADSLTGQVTYNFSGSSLEVQLDNHLKVNLINFAAYGPLESWRIDVNYPAINKTILAPGSLPIDASYAPTYPQFTWKMVANSVGLRPGEAWDFPVFDPQTDAYVSHFSNEGTPTQVATALADCINKFDSLPVRAIVYGPKIYMTSTLNGEEGASVLLQRNLNGAGLYANMGFYERNFCNNLAKITVLPYSPYLQDLKSVLVEAYETPTTDSYYLSILRTAATVSVSGRTLVNPTSLATALSTGTFFSTGTVTISDGMLIVPNLPFHINVDQLPIGQPIQQVVTVSSALEIEQYFVGASTKDGNRVLVQNADGQQYYQDKKIQTQATLTQGSAIVPLNVENLYIGAPISGSGIPTNSRVIAIKSSYFEISAAATLSGASTLTIGTISMFNRAPITQVWYQTLKGMYRRIKGWDVQGSYAYSLPSLEDPVYNTTTEKLVGFEKIDQQVLQVEDATQSFLLSDDSKIVAYSLYRPKLGVFSIFPIREFDFDFYQSDYAYTPTIEAFRYFFDEKVENGQTLELPLFENYKLEQTDGAITSSYQYNIDLEVFDTLSNAWYKIDTIYPTAGPVSNTSPESIVINTFFPLYDYDASEKPLAPMAPSTGERNFDKRPIRAVVNGLGVEIEPTRVRIRYNNFTVGDYLRVVNYNYEEDLDLKTFNGFAGLQDITTIGDDDIIQGLKDQGQYIDAYAYQLLFSEYDRLRENYTKDWALKSITVPYINKWVQEGTDARDNYYRLNNSMAFGIGNMSPTDNIDFPESLVLTHEWPYLDRLPKNYPVENIASSRSYMMASLSDVAAKSLTWYEVLKNDNTQDWFTKYFTAGSPTDLDYEKQEIYRPREERYTFFSFNKSQGTSFTLFRGGKLQGIVFNDLDPANVIQISGSSVLNEYKFAAVARLEPFDSALSQTPVSVEVIRNEKYKSIVVVITIRIQDYRVQAGSLDYMLQYFMSDLLSNSHQQQIDLPLPVTSVFQPVGIPAPYSVALKNFLPYDTTYSAGYTDDSAMRPKQGILGGGYLRLNDKRMSSVIQQNSFSPAWSSSIASLFFTPVNSNYSANLTEDITSIQNLYPIDYTVTSPFIYNNISVPITSQNYGKNGFYFSFHTTYKEPINVNTNFKGLNCNQTQSVTISPDMVTFGTSNSSNIFRAITPPNSARHGVSSFLQVPITNIMPNLTAPISTTLLEGGTQGFEEIQNFLTFGNIASLINSDNPIVEYYKVTDAGAVITQNFRLKIIQPDSIVKEGVLQYLVDEDKPAEYSNTSIIGYESASTNGQEYMLRHRGSHEPKTRDVMSFWLREEPQFSSHYQKDFLLSNTHLDSRSSQAGILRNYGFNKVSTLGNILTISRNSAYQSVYPLLNEVAVDHMNNFALSSTWDANFYRNYNTNTNYTQVNGIAEMKEFKVCMASKAMTVPKQYNVQTYNDSEVTFQLIEPALGVGVDNLVVNSTSSNSSVPNSNKPKLVIELDLRARLLREMIEDITTTVSTDEFERLQLLGIPVLNAISTTEIEQLRTSYFEKNIINLYEVIELTLYSKVQQGIELLNIQLTEQEKLSANYVINKDCVVTKIDDFTYRIEKTLEPNIPTGFTLSTTFKRI